MASNASRPGSARRYRDRGSVAVFTVVFALAVILLVALLVDGGTELNARERAADIAEQAARAAAEDISPASLRAGTVAIDWSDSQNNGGPCSFAQQAASDYAQDFGSTVSLGSVTCSQGATPQTATVTVTLNVQSVIPVLSEPAVTVTQSATATCGNADQQEAC
jgi:Flp pilus assembly protein TadG